MRDKKHLRQYNRLMFRSAVFSLFWAVISDRRSKGTTYKLQDLANGLDVDKSSVSRWFSNPDHQNCRLDTVSDIADELGLDLHVQATDRNTRVVYSSTGVAGKIEDQHSDATITSSSHPILDFAPYGNDNPSPITIAETA